MDGIHGTWSKIALHNGPAISHGLAPVGQMAAIWSDMRSAVGKSVDVEILQGDGADRSLPERNAYLRPIETQIEEWNSPEDEEAFGGLRPL